MKVELQCGDTIAIPADCKAIVKYGSVVIEKEEQKEQEFKDGDVLCSKNGTIAIFKEKEKDDSPYFYSHYSTDSSCIESWLSSAFHHATDEEKQLLFDKMKEQGLRWNADKKRVEKIRWRAENNKVYYYVGNQGNVIVDTEYGYMADENRYEFSNYFRTHGQVVEVAKRVEETLREYHEEIGE